MSRVKRPVMLIDRKTRRVKTFDGMTEAAEHLGVLPAAVHNALVAQNGRTHVHNHVVMDTPKGLLA